MVTAVHWLMMLLTYSQARAAVSQASIDELAAEINAETSEEPRIPAEVRQDGRATCQHRQCPQMSSRLCQTWQSTQPPSSYAERHGLSAMFVVQRFAFRTCSL